MKDGDKIAIIGGGLSGKVAMELDAKGLIVIGNEVPSLKLKPVPVLPLPSFNIKRGTNRTPRKKKRK